MSSVITISQPPTVPGTKNHPDAPTAMTFAPVDPDLDPEDLDTDLSESSEPEVIESSTPTIVGPGKDDEQTPGPAIESDTSSEAEVQKKAHEAARMESLEKLQKGAGGNAGASSAESPRDAGKDQNKGIVKLSWKRGNAQMSAGRYQMTSNPDAVIVLKEEKVRFFTPCLQTSSYHISGKHLSRFPPFRLPWVCFPGQNRKGCIVLTSGTAWNAQSHGTTSKAS